MSGYTTSISPEEAYKPSKNSFIYDHASFNIVNEILDNQIKPTPNKKYSNEEIRGILLNLSTEEFFQHYIEENHLKSFLY